MTKQIKTVEVSSFSDVIENLPEIIESFKNFGLVLIKGHTFSKEDHTKLTQLLGDVFGWNISSLSTEKELDVRYRTDGGQSIEINRDYNVEKDEYFLDWHIEQIYFISPPLAGLWHMTKLICPYGSGNTRFADSNEIFNLLDKDDQEFLKKLIILWDKPANSEVGPFYNKAVDKHPISEIPIIRIETDNGCYVLPTVYSVNGKSPTQEEENRFQSIFSRIKSELYDNEKIRYEQKWQEGDFLIVDFFRMYHAVMGGFRYKERTMSIVSVSSNATSNFSYNIKPEINS